MELKIKRLMTGLAGFAAALFLIAAGAFGTESIYGAEADGQGRTQDIIILHTNDVHCGVDDNIGYAGLALYKKEMLLETPYVTLVDAGDAIQGAPIGTLSDGEYIIDIMNKVGYDFAVPGNHEFDYGMERFLELAGKLNCGYSSCNFMSIATGAPVFESYKIFDYGDTEVAFVGISTPESYTKSTPAYFQDGQGNMSVRQLFEENLGKDFYEARKDRVQETLSYYVSRDNVTLAEADWWDEQDDKVGGYIFGNYKVWDILISNLPWVLFIMMIVCVGIAPVFAGEYQSKCDSLLLCMKHGKHRLILAKLTASFVYSSVLYWGIVALYSAVLLIFVGADGWDLPVQLLYSGMPSSYALTTSQALCESKMMQILASAIRGLTIDIAPCSGV